LEAQGYLKYLSDISTMSVPIANPIMASQKDKKNHKIDKQNNAGCVRNIGFDYIKNKHNNIDTEFIGFVDDDDTLHPKYIDYLLVEKNINNNLDLIIFRMIYKNNVFLPSKFDTKIKVKHFGISFAFKKEIRQSSKLLPT
jgi:glycosyltransferase involved in cell wall biosynthesis